MPSAQSFPHILLIQGELARTTMDTMGHMYLVPPKLIELQRTFAVINGHKSYGHPFRQNVLLEIPLRIGPRGTQDRAFTTNVH